jgi:cell division protein FtsB
MEQRTEIVRMKVITPEPTAEPKRNRSRRNRLGRHLSITLLLSITALIMGISCILYIINQRQQESLRAEAESQALQTLQDELASYKSELTSLYTQAAWVSVTDMLRKNMDSRKFRMEEVKPFVGGDPMNLMITISTVGAYESLDEPLAEDISDLIHSARRSYEAANESKLRPAWDEMTITLAIEYAPEKLILYRSPKKIKA